MVHSQLDNEGRYLVEHTSASTRANNLFVPKIVYTNNSIVLVI